MPEPWYVLLAVAVCVAVTWSLRALPFAVLAPLRSSALVRYLSWHLPAGVMVILFVYTVRDVSFRTPPYALPLLVALAATVGLHLWRRNAVLSILGGTLVHVVLASVVFPG